MHIREVFPQYDASGLGQQAQMIVCHLHACRQSDGDQFRHLANAMNAARPGQPIEWAGPWDDAWLYPLAAIGNLIVAQTADQLRLEWESPLIGIPVQIIPRNVDLRQVYRDVLEFVIRDIDQNMPWVAEWRHRLTDGLW